MFATPIAAIDLAFYAEKASSGTRQRDRAKRKAAGRTGEVALQPQDKTMCGYARTR